MNKIKFRNSRLNRILKYCCVFFNFFLLVPYVKSANTYSYLWITSSSASGNINYSGTATDTIVGTVDSLYTGTMTVVYSSCSTTTNKYVYYRAEDRWIFMPKTLTINGQSVAVSILSLPSEYTQSSYNDDYYTLKQSSGVYSSTVRGGCSSIGNTYAINYTYPNFSIQLDISALSVGSYSGVVPLKMVYAEYFGEVKSDITQFSDSLAFQYSSDTEVPYTINITNKCTVSPESLSLTHGSLPMGSAEGNTVSETMTVNCYVATPMTVTFQSRNIPDPATSYSDGVGVDLGNGWVSEVTIGDSGLSDVSLTDKTISVPVGGLSLPVSSTLRKNGTVTSGNLSGSLVISLELK